MYSAVLITCLDHFRLQLIRNQVLSKENPVGEEERKLPIASNEKMSIIQRKEVEEVGVLNQNVHGVGERKKKKKILILVLVESLEEERV